MRDHDDNGSERPIRLSFEAVSITVAIAQLVPLKTFRPGLKESSKYTQILSSIKAVGLVEAPVVARDPKHPDRYFLLDGHLRIEALKDIGVSEVECIVSTDDETYTYNKRVNRLSAVQEHGMILRAIERGVPEAQIAEALGLDPKSIQSRVRMLNGICRDAIDILKDSPCPIGVFSLLRQMAPIRQIEAAEIMVGQNNFTAVFARVLLAATPDKLRVTLRKKKDDGASITSDQLARMERELFNLQMQVKSVEESYGADNLQLILAIGYVKKLLANSRVVRWLTQHHPEYLSEFEAMAGIESFTDGKLAAE
ncbi:plasmid partitioning protein RepB C-terminal domain-containing protein [Pinisolibacter sp.]|uniref:plasmid partitioning protein RepB C-terminal domain-containing protein n=1 Tax=Pinisolibacter sp. TaxID=2172024 RepID=UPI002FDCA3EF